MYFIDSPNRTDSLEQLLNTKKELLKLSQHDASVLFALRLCNEYIAHRKEELKILINPAAKQMNTN